MIQLSRDHEIPNDILNLIDSSEEYVVIISPYINLWGHLTDKLEDTIKRDVVIKWYYREGDVKPTIINQLDKMGVQMKGIKNLHSKLYLSEKMGVMTSMNLYDFSSKNNREVGIVTDQKKLLKEFKDYIEILLTNEDILPKKSFLDKVMGSFVDGEKDVTEVVIEKVESHTFFKTNDIKPTQSNGDGHCIRCSTSISYNVKSPYCKKCYKSWNKYKNKGYEEKHCHQCSESHKTSFEKPICYSCFKS